jgi:hypothetical protein
VRFAIVTLALFAAARAIRAPRVGFAIIGSLFMLAMWAMSLEAKTIQIRADSHRARFMP